MQVKYRPTLLETGVSNELTIYNFKIHAFIIKS